MSAPEFPAGASGPADPPVPAPTDPELYLRLVAERTLLARDDHGHWGQGDLGAAASALVAVGLLPVAVAVAVVGDYQLAASLRGDGHARMMNAQPLSTPVTVAPTAPVVAVCRPVSRPPAPPLDAAGDATPAPPDGDDEASWAWDVHHVVLGDAETVLTVSSTTAPPWERGNQRFVPGRPHHGPTHPGALTLADDTGHVEHAHFSGGGGGGEWAGQYTTDTPLSPATCWLDFDGRRLDLERPSSRPMVRVEDHGSGTPAERHLRHRLAAGDSRHHDDDGRPDPAVEALVATGALAADAVVRAEIDAVRHARRSAPGPAIPLPGTRVGKRTSGPAPTPSALPACWSSALRTAAVAGPVGLVPIGVATPVLDGAAVVLRALTSTAEHFTVDTLQVGGDTSQRHGDHVEATPPFAWWARDDLGQWYRGDWNGWSGGEEGMTGEVLYEPALDPRARTLRLLPTMPSRRAVVEIVLPDWGSAP